MLCLFFRYITLLVTLPGRGLFYSADKVPEIIQELITVLSENNITDNPVIAHVFSNGGSMIYSRFTEALHNPSIPSGRLRLKGVVFDSAPSKWSVRMTVKAMMDTVFDSVLLRYVLGMLILFLTSLLQLLPKVSVVLNAKH